MEHDLIYCAGETPASRYARTYLKNAGMPVADHPHNRVTHLILDTPAFGPNGRMRMGGDVEKILQQISENAIIYGGNLYHPALRERQTVDFLQDEGYLAQNAYITAECALDVALPYLTRTLRDCPILIIGWGRIGKCLSQLLKSIGAKVTVAARKTSDRAMLNALGLNALDFENLGETLNRFRLIYNTVPQMILPKDDTKKISKDVIVIDLASASGIDHEDVVIARGLPGIHMPESSGKLIAETFLQYYKEDRT